MNAWTFWRLHLWVRQHPDQWTLDEVYARMLEINGGPPTDGDLSMSSRLSGPWLDGIGFLRLAELNGDLALEHDERYLTALIGLEPGLQLPLMRADQELREELVWGILRQEGNSGVSLSSSDRSATMGSSCRPVGHAHSRPASMRDLSTGIASSMLSSICSSPTCPPLAPAGTRAPCACLP